MNYLDFKKKLLYYYYFANYNLIEATNEIIFKFELKPEYLETTNLESIVNVSVIVDSLLEPREIQNLQVDGHIVSIFIDASINPWETQDLNLDALIKFISSDDLTSYNSSALEVWDNTLVNIEIDLNKYLSEILGVEWDLVLKTVDLKLQGLESQDLKTDNQIILSTIVRLLGLETSKLRVDTKVIPKIEALINALQSLQLKLGNTPEISIILEILLNTLSTADLDFIASLGQISIQSDLTTLVLNYLQDTSMDIRLKVETFLNNLTPEELSAFFNICFVEMNPLLSTKDLSNLEVNLNCNKLLYTLNLILRITSDLQSNLKVLMSFKETLTQYETAQLLLKAKIIEKTEGKLDQYSSSSLSDIVELIAKIEGQVSSQPSSDLETINDIIVLIENELNQYGFSDLKDLVDIIFKLETELSSYSSQGLLGELKACFNLLNSFLTTADSVDLQTKLNFKFLADSKLLNLLSNSLISHSDSSLILDTSLESLEGVTLDFLNLWSPKIFLDLDSLESNLLNQNLNAKLNVAADLIALPGGDIYISYYDNDRATLERICFKESWNRNITEFLKGLY